MIQELIAHFFKLIFKWIKKHCKVTKEIKMIVFGPGAIFSYSIQTTRLEAYYDFTSNYHEKKLHSYHISKDCSTSHQPFWI